MRQRRACFACDRAIFSSNRTGNIPSNSHAYSRSFFALDFFNSSSRSRVR